VVVVVTAREDAEASSKTGILGSIGVSDALRCAALPSPVTYQSINQPTDVLWCGVMVMRVV
jgi:hypothetical protein